MGKEAGDPSELIVVDREESTVGAIQKVRNLKGLKIINKRCFVCDGDAWLPLPNPDPSQSVTTTGMIIQEPLGKAACLKCGLVQRVHAAFLGLSSYYEEDYADYYKQGDETFQLKRYQKIVDWMHNFLIDEFKFNTVLDIG